MPRMNRRSALEAAGVCLGVGLAGCLGPGDTTEAETDSPSETPESSCEGTSTDDAWQTSGSWELGIAVRNDDAVAYTVTATVVQTGTEPCHHAESTSCGMPEQQETALDRTFELAAEDSRTVSDLTLDLWEDWIDEYAVEVHVQTDGTPARDGVLAYETGAEEPVGEEEYDRADFYVCNDVTRSVESTISDGTPHTTH